jgi:hypothetical protein
VQFLADGVNLGSAVPLTNGVAQVSTSSLSVGTHNITAAYTSDSSGFSDSATSSPLVQSVTYGINVLFDQTKVRHAGSTIPIQLQLTDSFGNNLSTAGVGVHALYMVAASNPNVQLPVQSPGNSQPGNNFTLNRGTYNFNLKTTGLASDTYTLYFSVDGDPIIHSVTFIIG